MFDFKFSNSSKMLRGSDSQIWNIICSQIFPYFLVFLKYFVDKYGVRGCRFSHMFGRSRHVPKSIAIDQESLISNLGIIYPPTKSIIILKIQKKQQIAFLLPFASIRRLFSSVLDLFCVPYRARFWISIEPWVFGHDPGALSHEAWTSHKQLIGNHRKL